VPTNEQAEVVIEEGVTLRGKLFLERPSVIRGCFVGEIYSQSSVIIAETASTQALIVADYVTIQGKQEGEIRAKKGLQVSRSGEIVGRISTASLGLEQGSQFRGSSMMVSESA
jgi:cytoskeletal protein CcmA (bactofilin family)